MNPCLFLLAILLPVFGGMILPLSAQTAAPAAPAAAVQTADIFAPENIMAWCIVPFDAKKRGPEERAAMMDRLNIHRLAYDWRDEHIITFDAEAAAMKKRGIEISAWWFPGALDGTARNILAVIRKHKIKPQLWVMGGGAPVNNAAEQKAQVDSNAANLKPLAEAAAAEGCSVALYNHGGWFGEPENQLEIIEALEKQGITNVGIVYNFHHGHEHMERFPEMLEKMQFRLLAVNLNGMDIDGERIGRKILHLGEGTEELEMMRTLRDSGWKGPVGIIDHRPETDSEVTLGNNLRGLEWLRKELKVPGSGGSLPFAESRGKLEQGKFGQALDAGSRGVVKPAQPAWRLLPLTVDLWTKLRSRTQFNILTASEPKTSATHWELHTHAGTGDLSVFMPGRGGDFRSNVNICDDRWHHVALVLEEKRVRLFIDGKVVVDAIPTPVQGASQPGGFGLGMLAESGVGCDGLIDEVRLRRGAHPLEGTPDQAPTKDGDTLGLWRFDDPADLGAAVFNPRRAPLYPAEHPLHRARVNRDRIYDFYAKQAIFAMSQTPMPDILSSFPGLDGGKFGHWGNQNEETWKGEEWGRMDVGSVQAGVFRGWGLTVPRGVCVNLGDPCEMAACFDPDTLTWAAAWTGGFVKFGTFRHGFMEGLQPAGERTALPAEPAAPGGFRYHGFYRNGPRVVFHYTREGVEWLESASVENGKFVKSKVRADAGGASRLSAAGPAQWPQVLETKGVIGSASPYTIDTVTVPASTPWNSVFHMGDHDFFDNGDAALCTIEGEVWLVSGLDADLGKVRWKRFAAGLHQPLGLKIADGAVYVLGRDQITLLKDNNSDGEADAYQCFSNAYTTSSAGHEFITGLQRDSEGRFYFASGNQGICRISPDGLKLEVLATGFRNPDGLGLGPRGEILAAVQEGDWTPASMLAEVKPGAFYGYGGPAAGRPERELPLVYLPRALDNSCGGQVFVDGERWGLSAGTPIHLSFGAGAAFAVIRDTLLPSQAGVVPLPGDFSSGAHRGRFNPRDGQLWVTGSAGWGTYTPDAGCFQRLRYTGGPVTAPVSFEARENGVMITFSGPLPGLKPEARDWFAQAWNYRYGPAYGSDEWSVRNPDTSGHDVLEITSVHVTGKGKRIFLEIPQLQPSNTLHLHCRAPGLLSRDIFLTAHKLSPAFTDFPGYAFIAKAPVSSQPVLNLPGNQPMPVKWEEGPGGRELRVHATTGLQFAEKELEIRIGERISLVFENPDVVPHNWVLGAMGSTGSLVEEANRMISEPGALARHYVPDSPEVLVHTRLVEPAKSTTIHFTAPTVPGDYPYLCSFPGHAMIMRGVLHVK